MGVYKHQNGMGLGLNFKGWTLGLGETLHRNLKLKKNVTSIEYSELQAFLSNIRLSLNFYNNCVYSSFKKEEENLFV